MLKESVQAQSSQPTGTGQRLRVMLLTEGNYPYHWGGVSTWCQILMHELNEIDFVLYPIIDDPALPLKFSVPKNVVAFRSQAIWGFRHLLEERASLGPLDLWRIRRKTTEKDLAEGFLPDFRAMLTNLFTGQDSAIDQARVLHRMHCYFLAHDYDSAMRSRATWRCFMDVVQQYAPQAMADRGYPDEMISMADATKAIQWLFHWLTPLGRPVPRVDVAHAAMAGLCSMVAVIAKLDHGAAFLLTEHGVYLRERYFFEAEKSSSLFLKCFSLFFSNRMNEMAYGLADRIAPCCDFNQRWELRNGVDPARLKTIYYGVDSSKFSSQGHPPNDPLVVVWMGRIDPLKDLVTLIEAAALVHQVRPEIQFRLFGSAPPGNEAYNEKCLDLRRELGLEETVIFAGFRSDTTNAYNEGDIFVLSSKSEAFPFVNLEAMLCERPVVSSAVGGVPEQLEGCGFAVEPRNPQAMADAILKLAGDPELRATFGRDSRQKVITEYSVERFSRLYGKCYQNLYLRTHVKQQIEQPVRIKPAVQMELAVQVEPAVQLPPLPTKAWKEWEALPSMAGPSHGSGDQENHQAAPAIKTNGKVWNASPRIENMGVAWLPEPARTRAYGKNSSAKLTKDHCRQSLATSALFAGSQSVALVSPWFPEAEIGKEAPRGVAELAGEVAERDPKPIDSLEVTALLEAQGITDAVARQRHGFPSTFELGEAVLAHMRESGILQAPPKYLEDPDESLLEKWFSYARGPITLVSILLALLIITAVATFTAWEFPMVIALSTGMTASMVINSGFLQAASRRLSIYQGMKNHKMARLFFLRATLFFGLSDTAAALLIGMGLFLAGVFDRTQSLIFTVTFAGFAWLWMMGGMLSIAGKIWWTGVSFAAGLLAGAGAAQLVIVLTPRRLVEIGPAVAWGAGLGYASAFALLIFAIRRVFTGPDAYAPKGVRLKLPSLVYLFDEAGPYALYGVLYMSFIFMPHILAMTGGMASGVERLQASIQMGLVLTLAMVPITISSGMAERWLRLFWKHVSSNAASSPFNPPQAFQQTLLQYANLKRRKYLGWLLGISLFLDGAFLLLLQAPWFTGWAQIDDAWVVAMLFQTALVAFVLVGLGVYNTLYCLTLCVPLTMAKPLFYGLAACLIIGIPASAIDYRLSVVAFSIGAIVFHIASGIRMRAAINEAAYHIAFSI